MLELVVICSQNYRYLDLLNVLCVCDGVAIQNNQTYITEHWLRRDRVRKFNFSRSHKSKKSFCHVDV